MKLSDLRPCVACNGPLFGPGKSPIFYILDVSQAALEERAARQVLGLSEMFKGHVGLAEAMAPNAEEAVMVFAEEDPKLRTRIFLCQSCALSHGDFPSWLHTAARQEEARERKP